MAIDTIIEYECYPREALGIDGIINRLKGKDRAETIIQIYRDHDDDRAPSEMGFEFTQSTPEGESETQIIVVQDLLNQAEQLKPLMPYCEGCPANASGEPFGCIGSIKYPISSKAEAWLLNQLPSPNEPLVWLLLRQGIEQFTYDGESIRQLRETTGVYFEDRYAPARNLGEFMITSNQVLEMIVSVGTIQPNHAGILLLFFNAIERNGLEADTIMNITPAVANAEEVHPFILTISGDDDESIIQFKQFFYALYTAWRLNTSMIIDA